MKFVLQYGPLLTKQFAKIKQLTSFNTPKWFVGDMVCSDRSSKMALIGLTVSKTKRLRTMDERQIRGISPALLRMSLIAGLTLGMHFKLFKSQPCCIRALPRGACVTVSIIPVIDGNTHPHTPTHYISKFVTGSVSRKCIDPPSHTHWDSDPAWQ